MKRWNMICTVIFCIVLVSTIGYTVFRLITTDNTYPVIKMETESIEVSVKDEEEALLQGLKAYDEKDGDVTSSIQIEGITEFLDDYSREITYVAFDKDNHVAKATRRIRYSDYRGPHIKLDKPLKFPATNYDLDLMENIRAVDKLDGDISDKIIFSEDSMVNLSIASDYKVTLMVTNSAGDTQTLPVKVVIYDSTQERLLPQIELNKYLVYTTVGHEALDLTSYLKGMSYNGENYEVVDEGGLYGVDTSDLSYEELYYSNYNSHGVNRDRFDISANIDYNSPGVYEVVYSIRDYRNNIGKVSLYVVVEDR